MEINNRIGDTNIDPTDIDFEGPLFKVNPSISFIFPNSTLHTLLRL